MPRNKRVHTYFHGEGALSKKRKWLPKEEWNKLRERFPNGLPKRRRYSDGRPQRTLKIYDIRASTVQEVRDVFVHFGAVLGIFIQPDDNCAYVAYATTEEAKEAKKALDLQSSYNGEYISFILRKVEKRSGNDLVLHKNLPYAKLLVDFCPIPQEYASRMHAVPAWRRGQRQPSKAGSRNTKSESATAGPIDDWCRTNNAASTSFQSVPFVDEASNVRVEDDFYDDSEDVLGEWARCVADEGSSMLRAKSESSGMPASGSVLGKACNAPVEDDYYDDSEDVLGEWAKCDPPEDRCSSHSNVRVNQQSPSVPGVAEACTVVDDFYDDSEDVLGEWAKQAATSFDKD